MTTITITCKCGEEIPINPASLLAKKRKPRDPKFMSAIATQRHADNRMKKQPAA